MTEISADAPLAPLREAVAEKAKVTPAAVDLVLSEIGVGEERPTRRADTLTIRRLAFSGVKRATKYEDGPYQFTWSDLGPGLFGILSRDANQIGKSTVLDIMVWALRGRPRSLKPEVRAWIDEVELEFTIGGERYCVSFTDLDSLPQGKLVLQVPGPARTLQTFKGEEQFEQVMGDLMMQRFALQPIPNISHTGEEASQFMHAWTAYVASMFIEGSHPAILGDVTTGALWWRMLQLFMGMPYAATHMALRNALTLEQAQAEGASVARAAQARYGAEIKHLEGESRRLKELLRKEAGATISARELDELSTQNATLLRQASELQVRIAELEITASALGTQRDEAKATQRRLKEGAASRKVFAGLDPVCCPRCASAFEETRSRAEESEGRCAVCDRATLNDDAEALEEALLAARERVEELVIAERAVQARLSAARDELAALVKARTAVAGKVRDAETQASGIRRRRELEDEAQRVAGALDQLKALARKDVPEHSAERLMILKAAEQIAEARMKAASADVMSRLGDEMVIIAQRFGFKGLESVTVRGNGIQVSISGVSSWYSKQTPGQRLRLRIALIIGMMRMAHDTGFGHHPGLLLIDSPGSEELSEPDLLAMISEINQIAKETPNLQMFVASARGSLLEPAFHKDNLIAPRASGTMF
jgi:hypothetical protein